MELISKITKDKALLFLFVVVLLLAVFVRFDNFSEVGYWNDDQATIPAGLMWFYPHDYFPGLNYGNPPLGDMIIGAGCMLSGEDFSGVSQVKPFFYPDRFNLLGEALSKADSYCHIPMYVFGLFLFILIIIFAFTFFDRYSAFFLTTFFAFYPTTLFYSRWIKPDVIFWTFEIIFLFFLLKFYTTENREIKYLISSAVFLGLAFATKFTAGILFLFAGLIILDKYKKEFLSILKIISKKLNLTFLQNKEYPSPKELIKNSIIFTLFFIFTTLIPYKLNPLNIIATQKIYQRYNQNLGGISFNLINIFNIFKEFVLSLNIIETLLFPFSLYVLIMLIKKKEKHKLEKFILYLFAILILTSLLFPVIVQINRAFPLLLSLIFLLALIFSKEEYSIFNVFKIKNKKLVFSVFLILYIILSSSIAIQSSPYFVTKNHLICPLTPNNFYCQNSMVGVGTKAIANYLEPVLGEDETFIGYEGVLFFYLRPQQGLIDHQFNIAFQQQIGREPTFLEKIQYFRPDNKTIRYLILPPEYQDEPKYSKDFKKQYSPTEIIKLKGSEVAYIYDLRELSQS